MDVTEWVQKRIVDDVPVYQVVLTINVEALKENLAEEGADDVVATLGRMALDAIRTLEGEIASV